ncbi:MULTISPECIES: virulence factor Mce family protein [Mycolicibacterium]|jgi:phospholipid/cholesterol/gamma-HCH transport system substrate-binding protein|uniref:virulence factor Mce family protein n=1 Tax=Mycolicibacterium TaxID=1866885 RepID=UPI001F19AC92|nr:virulence factor Mce family protein [Mycolicibacterium vanbaalenii]UJL31659.1 virulence factor Mce family protein [Mycolicibacterium vanbaalenii]WND59621.1 virulence factor Mce family protein [Mycolicibacterium vanbaalenii]
MKPMTERNPLAVGAVGAVTVGAVLLGALNFDDLPFADGATDYSAYFADAAGLQPDAPVQVAGLRVGQVTDISLDGPRVLVEFDIDKDVRLGDRTEAAIKTKTVLGAKYVEVIPRGAGGQSGPIPLERTTSPYQLTDVLGDLASTINGLDTAELSTSLDTLAHTFSDTPPELRLAVQGVSRFADTLNQRDEQLRSLLSNVSKVSGVLAERSDQIVSLVADTNALLSQLRQQSSSLDQISANISAVSRQIKGFITENRPQFKPALDKLNGVLTIVERRKEKLQESITRLNGYSMSLGEAISSGPFFKGLIANLPPGQFIQPFVEAAFSDLGLDPNVLMPSQLTDPPVGQPATPALPVPYPRTGQGGEPRLTLPDAITGNPGDPRYPYREPVPAPPPGGPPPGPPEPVLPAPTHGPVVTTDPTDPSTDSSTGGSRPQEAPQ